MTGENLWEFVERNGMFVNSRNEMLVVEMKLNSDELKMK